MKYWLVLPALLIGLQAPASADTILPGTEIPVRTEAPIVVNHWDRGRIYPSRVARDVYARDGDLAIPRGAEAELIVREIGPHRLALDLESIEVRGRRYVMETAGPQFETRRHESDQGGGLVGAIIGAIAGATGSEVETHGREIRVPAGALLRFNLQEPLHLVEWGDPGYMEGGHHYHRDHDWYR